MLLDAGPLGLAVHPRATPGFRDWLANLRAAEVVIVVPEIADFEVRRELLRLGQVESIGTLDALCLTSVYQPITTPIMRRAAVLWADARRLGRPTADPHALDGDVILGATALELSDAGHDVSIATTNAAHLARYAPAKPWNEISP